MHLHVHVCIYILYIGWWLMASSSGNRLCWINRVTLQRARLELGCMTVCRHVNRLAE